MMRGGALKKQEIAPANASNPATGTSLRVLNHRLNPASSLPAIVKSTAATSRTTTKITIRTHRSLIDGICLRRKLISTTATNWTTLTAMASNSDASEKRLTHSQSWHAIAKKKRWPIPSVLGAPGSIVWGKLHRKKAER